MEEDSLPLVVVESWVSWVILWISGPSSMALGDAVVWVTSSLGSLLMEWQAKAKRAKCRTLNQHKPMLVLYYS